MKNTKVKILIGILILAVMLPASAFAAGDRSLFNQVGHYEAFSFLDSLDRGNVCVLANSIDLKNSIIVDTTINDSYNTDFLSRNEKLDLIVESLNKGMEVIVLGGTGSGAVEDEIIVEALGMAENTKGYVLRVGGKDRYETAVMFAGFIEGSPVKDTFEAVTLPDFKNIVYSPQGFMFNYTGGSGGIYGKKL